MLGLLGNIAGLIFGAFQWLTGYFQRQIGKKQQQQEDESELNSCLRNELIMANKPDSAVDSLRDEKF